MAAYERTLKLSNRKRKQLIWHRDRDPHPSVRERSAAMLKIADGHAPHWVAQQGLLKARDPDTVYQWLNWYEGGGLAELIAHTPGGYRGVPVAVHRTEIAERLQQPPEISPDKPKAIALAPTPCRWSLNVVRAHFDWLADYTLSGVWRVLQKLDIQWKHGYPVSHPPEAGAAHAHACATQGYVRQWSPDPEYADKLQYLEKCLKQVAKAPKHFALLFLDEMGYYRWPSAARDWIARAVGYPLTEHGDCNNQQWRVIGALNAYTGSISYLQNYIVGRPQVIRFHQQLHDRYRRFEKVFVVEDNWNVHTHPEVNAVVECLPRLERVWLPTYASWLNPIEKLWRWTRQSILHHHRMSDRWPELRQRVAAFFDQFADGSKALLHYVGLLGKGRFAKILHA